MRGMKQDSSGNLTPMMQQYKSIHDQLDVDTILFFRLGDFYEMFFSDAEYGAKVLGLTLTQRSGYPMAGIPYHASETYISRLLKSGRKVAICDQLELPQAGKKLVDRAITRIITPGTVLEDEQLEAKSNHYIACLEPQKGRLNAAWLDLSTSEFKIASETNVEDLMAFLASLNIKEYLIPENLKEETRNVIDRLLEGKIVSEVPQYNLDLECSQKELLQQFGISHFEGWGIEQNCPALGCAHALWVYVCKNLRHSPHNLKNISLYNNSTHLVVDTNTQRSLEIFKTQSGQRTGSLLDFLDQTKTAAGSRLVQQFLSQPQTDLSVIRQRQQFIQVFYDRPLEVHALQESLQQTRDIVRILSRLYNRVRNPRELRAIQETLAQLPNIRERLQAFQNSNLNVFIEGIHCLEPLKLLLERALEEDLPNDIQDGKYIRSGFDETLDQLRDAQKESQSWLAMYERQEQEKTGIKNLKVRYTGVFGFFIEVTKSNLNLVPDYYVRKQTLTNAERFITQELKQKEDLILHAQTRSIEREKQLLNELVDTILKESVALQETAQTLAYVDLFTSWADIARTEHYVCPLVDDSMEFVIEDGRHPIVEKVLRQTGQGFIVNDLHLDTHNRQIMILTGPNMAGKSTYIRQNALIAFMAHLGSWVPAKSCHIGWMDRIFSRVGASDDLAHGQSTFMVEMLETANILNNATQRSLIILDEIGRGTSTYDGLSIAWSVVEYLQRDADGGPRTLFATHYRELTQLEKFLPRVLNAHVIVREWNDEIVFTHKIEPGCARRSYGIQVAKLAGLPIPVVERAKCILAKLEVDGHNLQKLVKVQSEDRGPQLDLF